MPCTVPVAVLILHEPVARTAIRPPYTPTFLLAAGTTARTMSPVRKPPTTLVALEALSGKPCASVRHICRLWRPIAVMARGTTPPTRSVSGVLAPTQAAAVPCAVGGPRRVRFHFRRPPVPT